MPIQKKHTDERKNINHNMSRKDFDILMANNSYHFTRTDHINKAIKEYIAKYKLKK